MFLIIWIALVHHNDDLINMYLSAEQYPVLHSP